jgi:hypothetical protein
MSGMVSSGSGIASSYYESRAQASVLKREEQQTAIETEMAQEASAKKFKQLTAEQRTLYGKAGVDITSGSPLLIMADTAAEGELEKERIGWAGYEKRKQLRWYQHVIKHAGDAAMSANATALSAQIIGMAAGGIAGGAAGAAAGTGTAAGAVTGAISGAGGGGMEGIGSFLKWITSRKPNPSGPINYGLGVSGRTGLPIY